MWLDNLVPFEKLKSEVITALKGCDEGSDCVHIETASGRTFALYHNQDCCEHVRVVQVDGDPQDLVGHVVELAVESSESGESGYGTQTWTFYSLGGHGGYVTIRWLGESSGYYSESVNLFETTKKDA